ncbi:MAG TPA: UMP kinase [Candidatus Thermoplasmatota archaeon]|nr:UMP kinase [Candidatus Thermoplasmatota archaeon]
MDAVAVSIGGSFLVKENGVDAVLARDLARILERVGEKRRVLAVVGGGALARTYIRGARELGADEATLDEIGIEVTRLNARVLIAACRHAYHLPPKTFDEALLASRSWPVVVMGGTHPGHTTDAVACMLGERARVQRLVIATNVDGVYDKDPKTHKDAKFLPRIDGEELARIASAGKAHAGSAGVVDALGARLVARSGLETAVVLGTDLAALEAALLGSYDFHGTIVNAKGGR